MSTFSSQLGHSEPQRQALDKPTSLPSSLQLKAGHSLNSTGLPSSETYSKMKKK